MGRNNLKNQDRVNTSGNIEFLDVEESNNAMIAMNYDKLSNKDIRYTHMEIHPSLILGYLASSIPFSDHNQAPRNCYQCLDPNELVLMDDGTKKPIKNINIGDYVVSFNPNTLSYKKTKVINHYIRPTEQKIYEIKTISGRKIIATENHPFFTNYGLEKVSEIDNKCLLGISLEPEKHIEKETNSKIILTKEKFVEECNKLKLGERSINKYVKLLEKLEYFNKTENDYKYQILSKLIDITYQMVI